MKLDNRKILCIYGVIAMAACFVTSWAAVIYPDAEYVETILLILVLLLCVVALLLMKRNIATKQLDISLNRVGVAGVSTATPLSFWVARLPAFRISKNYQARIKI